MSEQENDSPPKPQRDWVDIGLKAFMPVVAGLLIAWAGFVSNYTLSSIANNQQSARLITELQISREEAESNLRKDVFDQALQAFLLKDSSYDGSLFGVSKQLLRLELLSLNFGDSLSLSPLFTEFNEDLKRLKPIKGEEGIFEESQGELRKRLYSLARRISSAQVSSLTQHGVSKPIIVPIKHAASEDKCETQLDEEAFASPDIRELQRNFGVLNDKDELLLETKKDFKEYFDFETRLTYVELLNASRIIELDGIVRTLEVKVSNVDLCAEIAKVSVYIFHQEKTISNLQLASKPVGSLNNLNAIADEGFRPEVSRTFTLDFFNFPMVDNTRLENNHRFAIVLEEFDLDAAEPYIQLVALIFPSEYASLRDRPGMQEARKLLEKAMSDNDED
jgi:hypothetical protein